MKSLRKAIFCLVLVSIATAAPGLRANPEMRLVNRQAHLGATIEVFDVWLEGLEVQGARIGRVLDERSRLLRTMAELPVAEPVAPHPRPEAQTVGRWALARGYRIEGTPRHAWLPTASGWLPVVRVETPWDRELPLALLLDARTGVVLDAEPLLETRDPLARVFAENPATTPQPVEETLVHLDPGSLVLSGLYAQVTTCVDREECQESQFQAQRDSLEQDFLYEPNLAPFSYDDPFAEVNAYRNLTAINIFMRQTFGWQGTFFEQTYIEGRVGKGDWYNAAYYRGNDERPPRIYFGQETIDFSYDADTAAHEFGHAFNDTLWDHPFVRRDEFGLDLAPNGIEEALADFWAIAKAGDPILNAYVVRARHADNDVTCPDGEMAEGHMSARFIDGALWSASKRIGLEALAHVLYRSLALMPQTPALSEFFEVLAQSADELVAAGQLPLPSDSAEILLEEAHGRGLLDDACARRLVPLLPGALNTRHGFGYGRKIFGGRDTPFGLQWQVQAQEQRPAFKLFFEWLYPQDTDPGFAVMIRRGAPVRIEWIPQDELEDVGPAYRAEADLVLEGSPAEVDYPPSSEPPLSPGETVYVQLAARSEEATIALSVTLEPTTQQAPFPTPTEPPPAPAPVEETWTAMSGCSAVPIRRPMAPLWWIVAAGL